MALRRRIVLPPSRPLSRLQPAHDEQGLNASQLPEGQELFDNIDGTITEDVPNEGLRGWPHVPFADALETLNKWHAEGYHPFTSRTEEHRVVTEAWLNEHGFKYHGLLMGKPRGGNYHWVDNHIVRATRYEGRFTDLVREQKTVEVFKGED